MSNGTRRYDKRTVDILAKSVFRGLQKDGFSAPEIMRFASELMELMSNEPPPPSSGHR